MVERTFWINKIESALKRKNIVWLNGVRRSGKTSLCKSLEKIEYFDCELPSVRRKLEDPELFLEQYSGQRIALDEIQKLPNPSELLKICADHFTTTSIVATGSSTLGASKKFKDTLTGRKINIHLPPVLYSELRLFKTSLEKRFTYGGLPSFLLKKNHDESEYQEWIDSFWAKDIQELFRVENKYAFQKFIELIFAQSGSQFEANNFSSPSGVSHTTIKNYLNILEATHIAYVLKPFYTNKNKEIISAPKVYAFDTGFICQMGGHQHLTPETTGHLWKHLVLNELMANDLHPQYWRSKQKHEIDFIFNSKNEIFAVECKLTDKTFSTDNLKVFRTKYKMGRNLVVTSNVRTTYKKMISGLLIEFIPLQNLATEIKSTQIGST